MYVVCMYENGPKHSTRTRKFHEQINHAKSEVHNARLYVTGGVAVITNSPANNTSQYLPRGGARRQGRQQSNFVDYDAREEGISRRIVKQQHGLQEYPLPTYTSCMEKRLKSWKRKSTQHQPATQCQDDSKRASFEDQEQHTYTRKRNYAPNRPSDTLL